MEVEDGRKGTIYVGVGVSVSFCVWVSFERMWNDCCRASSPQQWIKGRKRYGASQHQVGEQERRGDWSVTDSDEHVGHGTAKSSSRPHAAFETDVAREIHAQFSYSHVNSTRQCCSPSRQQSVTFQPLISTCWRAERENRSARLLYSALFASAATLTAVFRTSKGTQSSALPSAWSSTHP